MDKVEYLVKRQFIIVNTDKIIDFQETRKFNLQ